MDKELSYGEKAVGLNFNPSNRDDVHELKELYSKIIDLLDAHRQQEKVLGAQGNSEKMRLLSVAITEAQGAQMWAVKGVTWQ